ncbi:MAG: ZIP family metal transporter [Elusimicrobia bacterium]|nr:ZIP family metal transporter [Elusimicrobiota bacterium]
MTLFLFTTATFLSTILGGLCAIKYRKELHLLMGFTAGVLLGVVSFDIFPEIIHQVKVYDFDPTEIMIALVTAFLIFHTLEKLIVIHHAHEHQYAQHKHPQVGIFSALALAGHSFMDGVGIGLGFQISHGVGVAVSIAVIAHDFTDGMNSVTVMLNHQNTLRRALLFLTLDALAPILGVLSTFLFSISPHFLTLYLGSFAGLLLYIGASDILPEAHSKDSSVITIALTLCGALFAFLVSRAV